MTLTTHTSLTLNQINSLRSYVQSDKVVVVDGQNLDIAAVVAVSKYGVMPHLVTSESTKAKVERASDVIHQTLYDGDGGSLYGVTTGVGASAFTRTRNYEQLQRALVYKNLNGVLPTMSTFLTKPRLELVLAEDVMRGTIIVRLNTLIRGHSGIRWSVIEDIFKLLEEDIVPCAPKNNTISASGDLGTLAYIAGTLLGLKDIYVWHGKGPQRTIQKASEVLQKIKQEPVIFGPKEAIAILNGTAASCSAASQVLYDANVLLLAAQCVSVLAIEALRANLEPFRAFPHVIARPHPGQIEVAENIERMVHGSKFAFEKYPEGNPEFQLRQDRYHIRCVPQWVGPFSENLLQATQQISIELNSTTDNPIVDPDGEFPNNIYHAGNFQALSVADAMDKVRHAMQGIGKMLFAQHTEIMNHMLNRGLPPDCAVGEPNVDFGLKSSDLACAAYLSELGFLAGSFLPHIHSTEHHNQSINSMALASARHARCCVELLHQLVATHLYTLCQALDLREMNARYLTKLHILLVTELPHLLIYNHHSAHSKVEEALFTGLRVQFAATSSLASDKRFDVMCAPLLHDIYTRCATNKEFQIKSSITPLNWVNSFSVKAKEIFLQNRKDYIKNGTASDSLGAASQIIYNFVRRELDVPMRQGVPGMDGQEIGTGISEIYEAMLSGRMDTVWRDSVEVNRRG